MFNPLNNAALFLINTLFDLYLLVLMLRVVLCWTRSDYFNPVTQVIIKLTQPIIVPLRRFIPTYSGIEFSTLIVILLLELLKFFLIGLLSVGLPSNVLGLFITAIGDALKLLINIFFYGILAQVILSWVQPGYSPVSQFLNRITFPIMQPMHRLIPPVGGLDLSPIPALIILQFLIIILINPMLGFGMSLAFS